MTDRKAGSPGNPTGSSLIGQSVRRVEDDRLIRGEGRFLADLHVPGTLVAVFVRSPHAHATIGRVEILSPIPTNVMTA